MQTSLWDDSGQLLACHLTAAGASVACVRLVSAWDLGGISKMCVWLFMLCGVIVIFLQVLCHWLT